MQYDFFHVEGVADLVGSLLRSEPSAICVQAARSVWEAALAENDGRPLRALRFIANTSTSLYRAALDHLPTETFESAVRATPITGDEAALLHGLPHRLVRPALVSLVERMEHEKRSVRDIEHLLETLGDDDLDLLLRFGAHGFSQGYAAARRVWSLSPEAALASVLKATSAGASTAQVWFETAPSAQIPSLLPTLQKLGRSTPSWCAAWLARVLPRAGRAAPAVFALLRSLESTS